LGLSRSEGGALSPASEERARAVTASALASNLDRRITDARAGEVRAQATSKGESATGAEGP
jgi:hypothetical protein